MVVHNNTACFPRLRAHTTQHGTEGNYTLKAERQGISSCFAEVEVAVCDAANTSRGVCNGCCRTQYYLLQVAHAAANARVDLLRESPGLCLCACRHLSTLHWHADACGLDGAQSDCLSIVGKHVHLLVRDTDCPPLQELLAFST